MRWTVFFIAGLLLLSLGISLIVLAPITPLYYVGEGTIIGLETGKVYPGSVTPDSYEILVPTVPNILHVHLSGKSELQVDLINPEGAVIMAWQNTTIREDWVLSKCGLWTVNVSAPSTTHFEYEIYTTAPLTAHPVLIYASGLILLGTLLLLHSKHQRKLESLLKDVLFEQNIGGRWVFAVWLPLFAFIADAPNLVPNYPWLYSTLIVLTVIAVFSCLSLAYIKLYVLKEGILLEAPFLNFSKYYGADQIYGFEITKKKKQRWFLLYRIPTLRSKKEPHIRIILLEHLPRWLQALVFRQRFTDNTINFRPKSLEKFKSSMNIASIPKRDTTAI